VRGVAVLNVFESTVTLLGLFLYDKHKAKLAKAGDKDNNPSVGWGFVLVLLFQAVIFIQTVLYVLNDATIGFFYSHHNDLFNLVFIYIIPNGFWLLFPFIATIVLGSQVSRSVSVKAHAN